VSRRGTIRVSLRNPGFDLAGLKRKIVRSKPIKVGAHEVTPEAEVISWQMKDAIIGSTATVPMWGWSVTHLRPTALIDRSAGEERRIKIVNHTQQIELILLIAAVLLPIVLNAVASLARRHRTNS
jgi:hypothetical protein